MLAWCSSQVMTISSSFRTLRRPQAWATRLMPSVVPRTKTISRVEEAFRKRAHLLARAFIGVRGARRECVRGAMDVGIFVLVEIGQAIDHRVAASAWSRHYPARSAAGRGRAPQNRKVSLDQYGSKGRFACPRSGVICGRTSKCSAAVGQRRRHSRIRRRRDGGKVKTGVPGLAFRAIRRARHRLNRSLVHRSIGRDAIGRRSSHESRPRCCAVWRGNSAGAVVGRR